MRGEARSERWRMRPAPLGLRCAAKPCPQVRLRHRRLHRSIPRSSSGAGAGTWPRSARSLTPTTGPAIFRGTLSASTLLGPLSGRLRWARSGQARTSRPTLDADRTGGLERIEAPHPPPRSASVGRIARRPAPHERRRIQSSFGGAAPPLGRCCARRGRTLRAARPDRRASRAAIRRSAAAVAGGAPPERRWGHESAGTEPPSRAAESTLAHRPRGVRTRRAVRKALGIAATVPRRRDAARGRSDRARRTARSDPRSGTEPGGGPSRCRSARRPKYARPAPRHASVHPRARGIRSIPVWLEGTLVRFLTHRE